MMRGSRGLCCVAMAMIVKAFFVPPAIAEEPQPGGIRCSEFEASNVKKYTVGSAKVTVHTLRAEPGMGAVERCTAEFPSFSFCALSLIEAPSGGKACEVIPATSLLDRGRWLLIATNRDNAGTPSTCAMICQ